MEKVYFRSIQLIVALLILPVYMPFFFSFICYYGKSSNNTLFIMLYVMDNLSTTAVYMLYMDTEV